MAQLKIEKLKKRTFSKMQWSVRAYNDWRAQKLLDVGNFDQKIYEADLTKLEFLTKSNLCYALCRFMAEVTKVKDSKDYPGKTLYEMLTSIQKFLHQNRVMWKLLDDVEFMDLKVVLDNIMKERTVQNIGMTVKQASYIPYSVEEDMWKKGILGEDTPDKLRETVLFLVGINIGLRACNERYALWRDSDDRASQLSFERSENGKCCLVYREDTISKTNDGGLKSLKKDRKVVWVFPSENIVRCPVRLVDKYVSLLPPVGKKNSKANFYL